jgi:release factor glutamine methyltransferase
VTATQQAEPLTCRFGPLQIRYDARVLTPRPWTLLQSRWAAELAAGLPAGPMLELCAGAGQIGLVAAALTGRALVQVEADAVAAGYARANADHAGLADRVEVRNARLDSAVRVDERFPIILADPPYLASADVTRWPDDPRTAIDGGADGLDLVRACVQLAAAHLERDGVVLLQVAGRAQADLVTHYLETTRPVGLMARETRHHDDERAVMLLNRR